MDNEKKSSKSENLVTSLREQMETGQETVSAPRAAYRRELKIDPGHARHFKKYIVRALIFALAMVLLAQILFQTVYLPRLYRGGPVAIEMAVEQLENDLHPTPVPPPSLGPPLR